MKIQTLILTVFCISWNFVLWAQDPQITASPSQGCDSLNVSFSFSTSLSTVTSMMWNFGDGTTDNSSINPQKNYKKPGKYNVSLTLNNTNTSSIDVYVGRTPRIDTLNLVIDHRDTSVLGPLNYAIEAIHNNKHPFPYTYQWTIEGTSVSNNRLFVHQFDTAGLYNVGLKMTDSVGCSATFAVQIAISGGFYIPNVFTPNGDSWNDVYKLSYNDQDIISFQVYSRTGILIYKTEAKSIVWDGRLPSGDKVLPGIYFYVIETLNATSPIKKSGFFYIFY